jgi:ubiquinone/menaquinone biosynthesis C-methylase UbiE
MAAALGLDATGLDLAPTAIAIARRKARDRGLEARFLVADALELSTLDERFDTVLDCGLFHVFADAERPVFVSGLAAVTRPGGRYHMLCFSEHEPGDWGPRRVHQDEIRSSFADGWRVDSIERAILEITIDPAGAAAWLATITRSP